MVLSDDAQIIEPVSTTCGNRKAAKTGEQIAMSSTLRVPRRAPPGFIIARPITKSEPPPDILRWHGEGGPARRFR